MFPSEMLRDAKNFTSETETLQLHHVACALSPPAGPAMARLTPGSGTDPRAWFRVTTTRATETGQIQTRAHKRKQSFLMNHLFGQDKNVSTLFPFIQKVEHFKYISFSLLQQNSFQSGARNFSS